MGASFSAQVSAESNVKLKKHIDAAVTNVILDSNFTDLTNLADEKNCNRLVKSAARVFQQNKDTVDLELLRQEIYNQTREKNIDDRVKTSEKYHNKKKKTPRIQNVQKKCTQISKFYVLFAHLFSCIISTVNPSFKIDSNKKGKTSSETQSLDFCSDCVEKLTRGLKKSSDDDGDLLVKPSVCETNVSKSGDPLRFTDLPGMKALQQLYVNDDDELERHAKILYTAFTGKSAPNNIRRMDQIPPKIYANDEECIRRQKGGYTEGETADEAEKKEERRDKERREFEKNQMFYRDHKKNQEENARIGIYLSGVVGSLKERLFSEYVQHIKEMIQRAESNRSSLLEILSEMFVYTYDDDGNIDGVIINPSLNYNKLKTLVVRTRRIVIKLYTDCEEDYKTGLDIFFAMVQEKIAMKLSVEEAYLKKQLDDVVHGSPELYVPEIYQQYQGAEEFNKKQFIPLHFKSSVISIVKNKLNLTSDDEFKVILPELEAWINEEMENTTALLDSQKVAEDFIKFIGENDYSDENGSPPSSEYEYVAPSSSQVSSVSSAQVSSASASASSPSSAPFTSARTIARTLAPLGSSTPLKTPLKSHMKVNVNPTKLTFES